jgi:hypothetical protein
MKRLLTLLVFLALAGYLAFKGGVWWLAEQRLSEADQAVDETGEHPFRAQRHPDSGRRFLRRLPSVTAPENGPTGI